MKIISIQALKETYFLGSCKSSVYTTLTLQFYHTYVTDHNRVHATDVLHGVYYITTQPIPGFTQVNTTDIFPRQGSSSESGTFSYDDYEYTQ